MDENLPAISLLLPKFAAGSNCPFQRLWTDRASPVTRCSLGTELCAAFKSKSAMQLWLRFWSSITLWIAKSVPFVSGILIGTSD